MLREIANELLKKEPFKTELKGYQLITTDNFEHLKKGYHIKYVTLNEELKTGGTLISCVKERTWSRSYIMVMNNNPIKLKFQRYILFYKEHLDFGKLMRRIANNEINIFNNEIIQN